MADAATRSYRWTREVYDRAVEAGIFGAGDRIELIDGEIARSSSASTLDAASPNTGSSPFRMPA